MHLNDIKIITAENIIEFNKQISKHYKIQHGILNKSLIESAVGATFFSFDGINFAHGTIPETAAALYYKIIKNHAFKDANKRTAVLAVRAVNHRHLWR